MQYNQNILLVDDDITLIKILKNQLQSLDYIVHTAFNGAEALDLIFNKNIQIDIIIMDIVLGKDPDGIETAHKILEKINIPIIFHSAHSEKSIIEKIETITSYGFISKTSGITGMDASIKTAFKLFESNRMLAESRNHINAIINSTTDFIWSVDTATYKILSFNDSLYNFFLCTGVTLKTGMSHLDLFSDEEYRRNWDYYYRQAIEQGYFKCEYQTFYGSRTLDLRINAIKIDNKISYLSIFAKDITENKKLENLLKKSEEKFSKMFMLSPVAMSINDFTDKNRIIECNNAFSEHTGYSHDEVIGKTSADLNLYSDPDMRSKVIDLINKYHKITNFEYCLRRKNGDTRQGLLSADVVDINEKPCIIASSVDITERIEIENKLKDSEAKFSSAFENTAIGMALLSPQGKWLKVNKATCELLGYSQEELLSKTFHEVTHPDDLEADVEHVSSLLTGKANTYQMEKRYIRRCGNIVYGLLSVSLVRTPEGAPRFFISQIVDISQRKLAENELNISRERLKSSLLEKEALLRELYHRTKNNMQVICAMLMLYSSQTNNLEAISAFREIDLKIRTMALVHKKLYESNDLSNINLKEYVHDLSALFEKSYGIISKQIELELNVEEISVTIDIAIPCGLVINELFSNTFKYAFPDGSQGKIKLDIKLTPEKYIDLNYSDNGIGLPPGFDFRRDGRMGIQSIVSIIENQLQGNLSVSSAKGFSCSLKFKKSLYEIRV